MKTYLIDLDGTMYKGHTILDGAQEFLDCIVEHNDRFVFLTNNASRTRKQNVKHMKDIGFKGIEEHHFFTSSMAATSFIAKNSSKRNVFVLGQDGLKEALNDQGFKQQEPVDFVFVGMDKHANYQTYSKALHYLLNGAKLVGTNNDRLLASDDGFFIGNGSIVAMLEYASKQTSYKLGKPYAPILDECLNFYGLEKKDVIMVGDNLETDIKLGVDHGIDTLFVTTGVHSSSDCALFGIVPTNQVNSLKDYVLE